MSRKMLVPLAMLLLIVFAAVADDVKFSVGKDDTIRTVLSKQTGKRVTLKLDSGEELSGTVRSAGERVVHLEELSGKDFYDAVIDLEEIAAVIVRVR